MKVLVDEMYDGFDVKLKELGYDAYSVKKLIVDGHKLATDYSVINYAKENGMVLVTQDTENGKACAENGIPCVLLDTGEILKIIDEKIKKNSSLHSQSPYVIFSGLQALR